MLTQTELQKMRGLLGKLDDHPDELTSAVNLAIENPAKFMEFIAKLGGSNASAPAPLIAGVEPPAQSLPNVAARTNEPYLS